MSTLIEGHDRRLLQCFKTPHLECVDVLGAQGDYIYIVAAVDTNIRACLRFLITQCAQALVSRALRFEQI